MKQPIKTGLVLSGALLISILSFSQTKTNQSLNQSTKGGKMDRQNKELREYILLVRLPLTYGSDQAKEVRGKWNTLLEKWKADGTYVTSFVYPNDGYVVTGPEESVKKEVIAANGFKSVSNMVIRAASDEAALELAKDCPVLEQGGMIEVREVQPRPADGKKEMIRQLYEDILNTGELDRLHELISADYVGFRGERGPEGFAETVNSIRVGFPDITWTVEDLVEEGNKVVVRWAWKATNTGSFRGFPASNREITDKAIAIYEFSQNKVIRAWIQSDQLGFLQQMGIISPDVTTPKK